MSESDFPENPASGEREHGHPKPGRVALPLWPGANGGPAPVSPAPRSRAPARMGTEQGKTERPAPERPDPATLRMQAAPAARTIPLAPVTASERMAVGSVSAQARPAQPKAAGPEPASPKPEPVTRHGAPAASRAAPSSGAAASPQAHDQTDAANRPRPGRIALPRWQAETEEETAKTVPPPSGGPIPAPRARRGRRFGRALLLFLMALLVYDVVEFLDTIWQRSPYVAVAFGFLLALVFATALGFVLGELRQLRRLSLAETYHGRIAGLHAAGGHGKALPLTVKLLPNLPAPEAAKERFAVSVHDTHSDRDVIALFNRTVMHPLDRQAYSIITRAARDAAVGVTVSPIAALDAVIALWRSLKMIREIAQVYGFRPGLPGTLAIARRVLLGTALTATTDVIGNLWAEHLGGRVAGLLSAKLGEGVFAAIRVARLGLTTMEICRPLPFLKEDEPSLNRLRKEIVSGLIAGSSGSGAPPKSEP